MCVWDGKVPTSFIRGTVIMVPSPDQFNFMDDEKYRENVPQSQLNSKCTLWKVYINIAYRNIEILREPGT